VSTLSVIIITLNEELNIGRCLESVKWANEIIIVDSGSNDQTIDIAKSYGVKVFHQDWLGFGLQKKKALEYATCDWVLSLDADEVISDKLSKEIQQIISSKLKDSYHIKRISQLYGSWVKHGDWANDCPVRLILREHATFSNSMVHERFYSKDGPKKSKPLKNLIYHYSFPSVEMMLDKINSYTTSAASESKKSSLFKAVLKGQWSFFRSFVLRLGFLDGKTGFLLALAAKDGTFYKYLKFHINNKKLDKAN
tara:strand:- start:485 stop:1240 length:756 start_codon:yes stop_codon:yes gene_type:complete